MAAAEVQLWGSQPAEVHHEWDPGQSVACFVEMEDADLLDTALDIQRSDSGCWATFGSLENEAGQFYRQTTAFSYYSNCIVALYFSGGDLSPKNWTIANLVISVIENRLYVLIETFVFYVRFYWGARVLQAVRYMGCGVDGFICVKIWV